MQPEDDNDKRLEQLQISEEPQPEQHQAPEEDIPSDEEGMSAQEVAQFSALSNTKAADEDRKTKLSIFSNANARCGILQILCFLMLTVTTMQHSHATEQTSESGTTSGEKGAHVGWRRVGHRER